MYGRGGDYNRGGYDRRDDGRRDGGGGYDRRGGDRRDGGGYDRRRDRSPPRDRPRRDMDTQSSQIPLSTKRTRPRPPSQWDVKPAGYIEGMGGPTIVPAAPAIIGGVGAPSQQTRHARRLYVGGLGDVSEAEIAEFFNDLVRQASINPVTVNPVLSVYVNPERKFAFVEFNKIELANAIIQLDGLLFKGHPVKIRRPNDYAPQTLPLDVREKIEPLSLDMMPLVAGSGGGGMISSSGTNKIYIGGVPPQLEESQLHELLSAFGRVRSVSIVRGADGARKGYAFCEYEDPAAIDTAISGLNNLPIGDNVLMVSRAKTANEAVASSGANMVPLGAAPPEPTIAPIGVPSRVVMLDHMVTPEDLLNDAEYRDILDDITNEVRQYGTLTGISIPRPPHDGAGRVFLHYADVDSAVSAATSLAGRQFAGRVITARYYDEGTFGAGILTQ